MKAIVITIVDRLAPSVDEQPVVSLRHWRFVWIDALHLVGVVDATGKLRTTSPIVRMSRDRTIETSSGRQYHLLGQPGSSEIFAFCPMLYRVAWVDQTADIILEFDAIQ